MPRNRRADLFAFGKTFAAFCLNIDPQFVQIADLEEPWRTLILRLCAFKVDERPSSAIQALSEAISSFEKESIVPDSLAENVGQLTRHTELDEVLAGYVSNEIIWSTDLCFEHLRALYHMKARHFGHKSFDSDSCIAALDEEVVGARFERQTVGFSECDPLGATLVRLYQSSDDTSAREIAFRRLVKTALAYNRYSLMNDIRTVLNSETDESAKSRFKKILKKEDPGGTIWS